MHAWQRAMGPETSALKIAAMHSVTATQDAAEHSPLRDKQRPSGKGYYVGEQNFLAEFNPDTCSSVLLIRFDHKQGDSRHVHQLP